MDRAPEFVEGHALLFGHGQVHGQDDGARGVDGHGGGYLVQRDALKEALHVPEGVDGHPDLTHLALGQLVVGVVADLGGEVKGHGQARLPGLQEEMVALVGFLGGAEPGILTHGPEAPPVGGGLHRPGVGVLPGHAQLFQVLEILHVQRRVKPGHGDTGGVDELGLALRYFLEHLFYLGIILGLSFLKLLRVIHAATSSK